MLIFASSMMIQPMVEGGADNIRLTKNDKNYGKRNERKGYE